MGFSLIEIVVVMAIVALLFSIGAIVGVDTYKNYTFRSEQGVLVSVLEKARSRSMSNIYQVSHGVCFDSSVSTYVIFPGVYLAGSPSNESVASNKAASVSGLPECAGGTGVIFTQLSGTTSPAIIVVKQDAKLSITTVNYEGTIIW